MWESSDACILNLFSLFMRQVSVTSIGEQGHYYLEDFHIGNLLINIFYLMYTFMYKFMFSIKKAEKRI